MSLYCAANSTKIAKFIANITAELCGQLAFFWSQPKYFNDALVDARQACKISHSKGRLVNF